LASLNRIILIGRLTQDPEVRTTMDGTPVTKFNLAVDRNRAAGQKETDFIDVIAWRTLAESSANDLKKGQMALVEGRIQNRTFETKEGVRRYITEIIASGITLLEKGRAGKPAPVVQKIEEAPANDSFIDDDLPF